MNLLRRRAVGAVLALAVTASPAHAAPGDLDASFGVNGVLLEPRPACERERIIDVAPEPGGGFTALVDLDCGTYAHAELTRYLADGSRDPSFGYAEGRAHIGDNVYYLADHLVRFGGGSLAVPFDGGTPWIPLFTAGGEPAGATYVTMDGGGWVWVLEAEPLPNGGFAAVFWAATGTTWLANFTATGAVDTGFDGDGLVALATGPRPDDVAIRSGEVVTATRDGANVAVARYSASGGLLTSSTVTTASTVGGPAHVAAGADGSSYVGVTVAGPYTGLNHAVVHRVRPDGSPDSAYGTLGAAWVEPGNDRRLAGLLVDTAGRVVVVTEPRYSGEDATRVARLASGGLPDLGFGENGVAAVPFGEGNMPAHLRELAGGGLLVAAQVCCPGWSPDTGYAKLAT